MSKLKGKVAFVTGASRGIGRAIATRLAQEGALVAVHYGKNRDAAEEVVRDIERNGGTAFTIGRELGSSESILSLYQALDEALLKRRGDTHFDILVNNAGIALSAPIEDTTEEAYDEIMNINVKTPFFLIQQSLRRLRDEGRIINISSAITRISLPAIPAYKHDQGGNQHTDARLIKSTRPTWNNDQCNPTWVRCHGYECSDATRSCRT
nr:SDR family NAD(P)-dependent oxidoreductase [Bacillus sp. FJAT-28004]